MFFFLFQQKIKFKIKIILTKIFQKKTMNRTLKDYENFISPKQANYSYKPNANFLPKSSGFQIKMLVANVKFSGIIKQR